jgi:glycyl-tRNA synthetase beta chain
VRQLQRGTAAGRTAPDYLAFARAYVEAFAGPLHRFFERVYVNAEDERVRRNRKALLKEIARPMAGEFADLTLAVKKR